jgi:hypothetical protein
MQTKSFYPEEDFYHQNEVKYAAQEAVFGLHLNHKQAVKFVVTNAKTDRKTATKALDYVMVGDGYKNI